MCLVLENKDKQWYEDWLAGDLHVVHCINYIKKIMMVSWDNNQKVKDLCAHAVFVTFVGRSRTVEFEPPVHSWMIQLVGLSQSESSRGLFA
jgi:hypothetical protein